MARSTDTCIHYHWHRGLVDDDLEEVFHSQSLVGAYRCGERHHSGCSCLFEVLAECGVCLAIWQYHEAHLHEFLRCLQCLYRVWQQIAWVGVDLELQPVGAECLACHLCREDCLFSIAHAAGVWQQLDVRVLGDVGEQVVVLVFQFDALHCHRNHFRFRRFDGVCHQGVVVELSCAQE